MAQEVRTVDPRSPAPAQGAEPAASRPVFMPPADIYETGEALIVLCEMPGVSPENVDITLERRVLTLRGRGGREQHAGYRRVYDEYADGDYERVFTLSEDIDGARIEATHRDGVLHLVLPKAGPAKARKIELKPA
jgi:HSP20 family protein